MAVGTFKWNGPALVAYNQKQLEAGLTAVWIEFQRISRKMTGITNTGQVIKLKGSNRKRKAGSRVPIYIPGVGWRMSSKVRKRGGGQNKTQITIYPNSSRPGESVRRRTGIGQKNIVGGRNGLRARVGYTAVARYMTFHELGIRYPRGKQKRPTMVPALRRNHPRLASVMRRAADRTKP